MLGATYTFNPWRLDAELPLTYLGELDWVQLTPLAGGRTVQQIALFNEVDWAIIPGVNLRLRQDYFDPDLDVVDDHLNRITLIADIFPDRYFEIQLLGRVNAPAALPAGGDAMLILRGWF